MLAFAGCRPHGPQPGAPWTNSLGMRFVPAYDPWVLWDAYETRARDFARFVEETKTPWVPPDAETGGEYPAANVAWDDAQAFCEWLTQRERAARLIGPRQRYRLPTEAEWVAVASADGAYVWGDTWPPPAGAGNFAGEEAPVDQSEPGNFIAGYNDGFAKLAPVGHFAANGFGLHDLAGNVMEWCEDWYDGSHAGRVARGGSWINGSPDTLSLSHRAEFPPRAGLNIVGFRCVLDLAK
ncbi:MAG: formylglycine-generating enzyme family protein [Chthoniobacteraceae bacterium]